MERLSITPHNPHSLPKSYLLILPLLLILFLIYLFLSSSSSTSSPTIQTAPINMAETNSSFTGLVNTNLGLSASLLPLKFSSGAHLYRSSADAATFLDQIIEDFFTTQKGGGSKSHIVSELKSKASTLFTGSNALVVIVGNHGEKPVIQYIKQVKEKQSIEVGVTFSFGGDIQRDQQWYVAAVVDNAADVTQVEMVTL